MVLVSLLIGWELPGQLLHVEAKGWLRSSQLQVARLKPSKQPERSDAWPVGLGVAAMAVGAILCFVVFW